MESAAKRKAATAAQAEIEVRPSKRQKLPNDAEPVAETVESTTAMGLRFVESLRAAKDKTGRPIATHFLTLPDKNQYPEYYEVIKLPIAIDTIEGKLKRGEYTALAQVESDCKRLVNNAKSYNDKKSLIYEDAERVRKTASNFMVKHNPAYRDGNYVAIATPIPGEEPHGPGRPIPRVVPPSRSTVATPDSAERPRRAAAAAQSSTPVPARRRQSAAPKRSKDTSDYTGLNFQQAQEQIVQEMIDYVDSDSDLQIFAPFINLPSRSLKDYYQVIKHPMSLQGVQKKVRGVVGRNPPTGLTDLKTWDAFEKEMSLIWHNAREYNEDGSDIYNLSIEFEDIFKQKLAAAKAKVEEPAHPKLKLNMSAPKQQSLKIRLGHRTSPALSSDPNTPSGTRSSATPGVIIDNDALQRQKRHINESINGARAPSSGPSQTPAPSRNPFSGSRGSAPHATASPPAVNGVKADPQAVQSPALNSIRPASTAPDAQSQRAAVASGAPTASMLPPQSTSRPASGSPHPNGVVAQHGHGTPYQSQPPNYYVPPVTPHFENYRRAPLKSASEALIPKITLTTHPALNLPHPYTVSIPANLQKSTYSVTITLPPTHSYLQVIPFLPIAFTNRMYRIFVQVNGAKTLEANRAPVMNGVGGVGGAGLVGYEKKKGEPVYEAKLVPGVNRIEVDIIAEREKGKAGSGGVTTPNGKIGTEGVAKDCDVEKCTVFVHLMRQF